MKSTIQHATETRGLDSMKKSLTTATLIAGCLIFSTVARSGDLAGRWNLSVEKPGHQVVATLIVEFTDTEAPSCISGKWKRVKVISAKTSDKDFFPTSDPLSYEIENNRLTIGRNELCDAYLSLQGPLGGPSVSGDYFGSGLEGSTTLGHFTLSREQ
jgi:hypothetical protein